MASTKQSVTISTPQDGVSTYKVTYSYSGGTYYVTVTGTNPWVSVDAGSFTADGAIADASRMLDNWGQPGSTQNEAGTQLSQNISEHGQAAFASISPTVPPVSDPVAADAQTTADTTAGTGVTPAQGTAPTAVPTDTLQEVQVTAQPLPTQGTAPPAVDHNNLPTPPDPPATPATPPDNTNSGNAAGIPSQTNNTLQQASLQDSTNFALGRDWRVRLALAPGSNYLYNATPPGILGPLKDTHGVIFPYTPDITVNYTGNYEALSLTHSNYKVFQYQNSAIDSVTVSCSFTAQDTAEALYLLAVIHFFRSATKMFYGQDSNPNRGFPPPLCYLHGLGAFQFDNHPLVISTFTYTLPNEVDYIRVSTNTVQPGVGTNNNNPSGTVQQISQSRLNSGTGGKIAPGGTVAPTKFGIPSTGTVPATYVPTMMTMQITCYPIVNRNDISNNFSLRDYATGQLITKGFW